MSLAQESSGREAFEEASRLSILLGIPEFGDKVTVIKMYAIPYQQRKKLEQMWSMVEWSMLIATVTGVLMGGFDFFF